jgi:hypothetical protein
MDYQVASSLEGDRDSEGQFFTVEDSDSDPPDSDPSDSDPSNGDPSDYALDPEGLSDSESDLTSVPDSLVNEDAYNIADLDGNGLGKGEQAGVIHLVHGWTQRARANKVSQPDRFRIRVYGLYFDVGIVYIQGYLTYQYRPRQRWFALFPHTVRCQNHSISIQNSLSRLV